MERAANPLAVLAVALLPLQSDYLAGWSQLVAASGGRAPSMGRRSLEGPLSAATEHGHAIDNEKKIAFVCRAGRPAQVEPVWLSRRRQREGERSLARLLIDQLDEGRADL